MTVVKHCISSLIAALLVCAAPHTLAKVEHRYSGFATIGLAVNDSPDLVFRNDVTQDNGAYEHNASWQNDTRLGLQWQGRWSSQWETTVQVVAKDRFDDSIANSIEWAFVRYRPVEGLDFRLGRLGADAFMLSDFRQVGYTLPWVRPPQDMYGITSLYNFDGIDVTKRVAVGDALLNLKTFYGNSNEKYPTGFDNGQSTRFDFDLFGANANLEWSEWKLRYTYVSVEVNSDLTKPLRNIWNQFAPVWQGANDQATVLESRGKHFRYHQFGLIYDNNDWWFQGEYVRINSDLLLVANGEHAYASLGKRFGSLSIFGLTGYANPRDAIRDIVVPPGLPEPFATQLNYLALATESRLNGVRIKQHSYGLGARWDFTAKMALKLKLEKFYVDKTGPGLWFTTDGTQQLSADKNATVLSLAWDVLF
ncbi:MAG TPA: hypothetical protein VL995_15965 [Cellvibrio sp.]|nr:hypothetical protein [Cellvibrio sp.]